VNPRPILRTPLCDLLGCEYPVVQTAMGWVAGSSLVAATTNAGGFGFLAGATIAPDRIEAEILRVKELTGNRPFGLNFHMFQPNAQQLLDLAVRHQVRAVSYGRGPDKKTIARLRDAGIVCMPTVGALKHALKAVEMGANAITIQGGEGGGRSGGRGWRLLRWPRSAGGARLRRAGHSHGHAFPDDQRLRRATADAGALRGSEGCRADPRLACGRRHAAAHASQ
jgi:NAD(P)H-dependent flavin oxidoreductase YrpB (nitropropane dioxygenase family)